MNQIMLKQMSELAKLQPELTMGELLYSVLRPSMCGKTTMEQVSFLRELKDNDIMTGLEKAIEKAKNE